MVNVLGICGSPIKGGNTEVFLNQALLAASESGAQTELISLAGKKINECLHCNFCLRKQSEGIFCAQKDEMNALYPKVLNADALMVASPAYFGRLSGLTAIFLDRLRVFAFGNYYVGKMKNKVAGALTVAWGRFAGAETTLLSIDYAFLGLEMVIASVHHQAVLFGAGGFSSIGGTGEFDPADKKLVLRDEKALKSARSLGKRVVELAQVIKIGQEELSRRSL
jgi:multimeric flavodoxin WrbA